eukprot:3145003-Pleurochrysis_carterae.AAC.1
MSCPIASSFQHARRATLQCLLAAASCAYRSLRFVNCASGRMHLLVRIDRRQASYRAWLGVAGQVRRRASAAAAFQVALESAHDFVVHLPQSWRDNATRGSLALPLALSLPLPPRSRSRSRSRLALALLYLSISRFRSEPHALSVPTAQAGTWALFKLGRVRCQSPLRRSSAGGPISMPVVAPRAQEISAKDEAAIAGLLDRQGGHARSSEAATGSARTILSSSGTCCGYMYYSALNGT